MALRMSLYNIAQPVGAMLSGAMQGALSTNLEGSLGRAGWRWAFIINVRMLLAFLINIRISLTYQGVCTIFIALLAYVLLPGFVSRPISNIRTMTDCRTARSAQPTRPALLKA